MNKLEREIRHLLKCGVYCQHEIFNRMYPSYMGHYSRLRDKISEVKNKGL